jgi:hypothetical protein
MINRKFLKLGYCSLGAVIVAVATSGAAQAAPQPSKPPFCAGYKSKFGDEAGRVDGYVRSDGVEGKTLTVMAHAACDKPDDKGRQQQFAGWKQIVMDRRGLSDAQATSLIGAWVDADAHDTQVSKFCKAHDSADNARTKVVNRAWSNAVCNDNRSHELAAWYLDESDAPQPILQLQTVADCLPPRDLTKFAPDDDTHSGDKSYRALTNYAWCGIDARRLDAKQFEAAVDAEPAMNPIAKAEVMARFATVKAWADRYTAYYSAWAKKDADAKAVLFTAPEAAYEAWRKQRDALGSDFAALVDLEQKAFAGNKSAVKGCAPILRTAIGKMVSAAKPRDREAASRLFWSPFVYRFGIALQYCEAAEGNHVNAAEISALLAGSGLWHRGPRTAAAAAAAQKLAEVMATRESFTGRAASPSVPDSTAAKMFEIQHNMTHTMDESGPIAKVTNKGSMVEVTFKKVSWKEPTFDCKESNKITAVNWVTGEVRHELNCQETGSEAKSSQLEPVLIAKEYAAALKPGMFLVMVAGTQEKSDGRFGFPLYAFEGPKQKTLRAFMGFGW